MLPASTLTEMDMKTVSLTLYNYEELSEEAKKKAHSKWNENDDMPFLSDCMKEKACDLITEAGMTVEDMKVFYCLSWSQGDGAMIEGLFTWEGNEYRVKHTGHYYHERSTIIDAISEDEDGNTTGDEKAFEEAYIPVCTALARFGYDYIEAEQSEQSFIDACEANEYTFEEDGTMRNA